MAHSHAAHLPLGGLLIPCTVCGTGVHIDNHDGDGRTHASELGRVLTLLYYVNCDDWCPEDGGALRLHLRPPPAVPRPPGERGGGGGRTAAQGGAAVDVLPRADVLVCFRADLMAHEVRPCARHRFAASLWALAEEEQPGGPDDG